MSSHNQMPSGQPESASSTQQQQQQQQQQQSPVAAAMATNQIPNPIGAMGSAYGQVNRQAFDRMMQILRDPNYNSVEQRPELLRIFQENPALMDLLLRHRKMMTSRGVIPPAIQRESMKWIGREIENSESRNAANLDIPVIKQRVENTADPLFYECSSCSSLMTRRYRCIECPNLDFCSHCQRTHVHQAAKIDEESRKLVLNKSLQSLVHAYRCKNVNCQLTNCKLMKRVIQHMNTCENRKTGSCEICRQTVALGYHHTNHCPENMCTVPFCSIILKQKIKEQEATITSSTEPPPVGDPKDA